MSPVPSPTPIRRAIVRVLFSPAGLLCGFVVFVIATCPGARGGDSIGLLAATGGLQDATGHELATLDALKIPAGGSAEFGRLPAFSLRSSIPMER